MGKAFVSIKQGCTEAVGHTKAAPAGESMRTCQPQTGVKMKFGEFTPTQRKVLLALWKQESKQIAAAKFINYAEKILSWAYRYPTDLQTDAEAVELSQVIELHANALRIALERLNNSERAAWGSLVSSALRGGTCDRLFIINEGQSHTNQILRSLYALEEVAKRSAASRKPKRGPQKIVESKVIRDLASVYEMSFGRLPAVSSNGIFVQFLRQVGDIVGLEMGPDLVRSVLPVLAREIECEAVHREIEKMLLNSPISDTIVKNDQG